MSRVRLLWVLVVLVSGCAKAGEGEGRQPGVLNPLDSGGALDGGDKSNGDAGGTGGTSGTGGTGGAAATGGSSGTGGAAGSASGDAGQDDAGGDAGVDASVMCLEQTDACQNNSECCDGLFCETTTLGQVCCGHVGATCATPNGEDCCGALWCIDGLCADPP